MNAFADREILDLFKERPDLLAVADAVSSTQPRRVRFAGRRLVRISFVPAVAAVAAVVLLVVAAPWQHAQPAIDSKVFFQRALAVIGDRPVLHVRMSASSTHDNVVDLASGNARVRVYHGEFWSDAEHRVTRSRYRIDDGPTLEGVMHNGGAAGIDPAFKGFATQYRNALRNGSARIVGRTDVGGRAAGRVQVATAPQAASYEAMTVDEATFVPLTVEYVTPKRGTATVMRISKMESLPYRPALFKTTSPPPRYPNLTTAQGGTITVQEASRILGRPVLGLDGRTPDSIERTTVTGTDSTGAKVNGEYVVLRYGDEFVTLTGPVGAESLGFGIANVTPPEGTIEITAGNEGGMGWMKRGGLTVILDVPHGDVLSAARSLRPIG